MENIKTKVSELMLKNRRISNGFQYTLPSPLTYPFQWLWDSCFHAIILSHINPEDAKKELLSLVSKQFDDGMIPHMICWEYNEKAFQNQYLKQIIWGRNETSTITQPPMIAYAAHRIYQHDKDKAFLETIYPALEKFCRYLSSERDPEGDNLVAIINPDESGEDNSPRFDQVLGLPPKHTMNENFLKRLQLTKENLACNFDVGRCTKNFFWVKDVPINAIFIENLKVTAEIAKILGKAEDVDFFLKKAEDTKKAMEKYMLEDGIFWSTKGPNHEKIKVLTWHIFAPLFAKIVTQEQAQVLVKEYLLSREQFALPHLLPTVAKSDSSFNPEGEGDRVNWRGAVWMATNWFVFVGLKKYGFEKEAQKILDSTLKLLEKSGFRETFNPLTGDGHGARDFTWGGLVLDMIEHKES